MTHHLDRAVASDLSFESFQKRLRARELQTPELDNINRQLFGLPSQVVRREAFMADRVVGVDERTWNARLAQRLER